MAQEANFAVRINSSENLGLKLKIMEAGEGDRKDAYLLGYGHRAWW
jgi:hypothetical protein